MMRTSLIRIATAALTALSLAACSDVDGERDLVAPSAPSNVVIIRGSPSDLVDISAGAQHTCVRTRGGTVSCWGNNVFGQIGVPSTATCGAYEYGLTPCVPHPAVVTGTYVLKLRTLASFTTANVVRAGGSHTCILSSGVAWCWGQNWYGQIGNGATNQANVTAPVPVAGGLSFTGLGAGAGGTCGTSATLLYCWGHVGPGTPTQYSPTLFSWMSGWSDYINVGNLHACAMLNGGQWACWGDNLRGEIGADPIVWQYFDGPLGNPAFAGATNTVAGASYTCLDQPNGTVQCLGYNSTGQLGDPNFTGDHTFELQTVGGAPTPSQLHGVATGQFHACALDPQGAAWCWGSDSQGQLGRGNGVSGGISRSPVRVSGGLTFFKLAAGGTHTCGLTTNYRVFCWGDNYFGQLGTLNQDPPTPHPDPVQVMF
jgi:alpha-tubulin suppressor-like RCC1 family protein